MNPTTLALAVRLAKASDVPNVVIAAPLPFLSAVNEVIRNARLAAQDVSAFEVPTGARTGEVSATMLRRMGVRYAIIGHSERRAMGETDAAIAAKVRAAVAAGITPVLCVGEPWSVRKRGFAAAQAFVKRQLSEDLKLVSRLSSLVSRLVIAYEPIWAISTSKDRRDPPTSLGTSETPENAARMAQFITRQLTTYNRQRTPRILYGGSVNSGNAASFLSRPEFAGVLVGGASLQMKEFEKILSTKY